MPTTFSTVMKIVFAIAFASVAGSYFIGNFLQPFVDEHDRITRPYDAELEQFEEEEGVEKQMKKEVIGEIDVVR